MKKVIWMFAGQGAQYYQMGRALYDGESVFRQFMDRADELARSLINASLVEIIYRQRADRFEPFRRLLYTHPALLLFECALAEVLLKRGLRPDFVLGSSLGEFASLVIAGAISFEDALVALIKKAELIEYCLPRGGMLAILDSTELVDRHPEVFGECCIAAYNFSRNFSVSASNAVLVRVQRFLKEKGINSIELPVDYAFHSPQMDLVKTPCSAVLNSIPLAPSQIPVISAEKRDFLGEASATHLWDSTRNPVYFRETIGRLEKSGNYFYVDLSPSGSMATAVKYNLTTGSQSEFLGLSSPFGQEAKNLQKLVSEHER
jgi:acyl transferase domain-containing protein